MPGLKILKLCVSPFFIPLFIFLPRKKTICEVGSRAIVALVAEPQLVFC